jgi:hypothetical protein
LPAGVQCRDNVLYRSEPSVYVTNWSSGRHDTKVEQKCPTFEIRRSLDDIVFGICVSVSAQAISQR